MNPMRSSLPSSSWLVATVVPWLTAVIASPERSIRPRTLRTPFRKPSAGSAGVDGVFVVLIWPVSSSTATTSVNVPPVSMPMRTRRPLMAGNLSGEISGGEERRANSAAMEVHGAAGPAERAGSAARAPGVRRLDVRSVAPEHQERGAVHALDGLRGGAGTESGGVVLAPLADRGEGAGHAAGVDRRGAGAGQ